MQHGFVEDKNVWSALAPSLATRGFLVMATTLPTFDLFGCSVVNLGRAAAKVGLPPAPLPSKLVFVGHWAGVEAVEYVAERLHSTYPA
jgi:hypothetical protein